VVEAGAEELDEFRDHALAAQHLHNGQHEIGRGHALLQLARHLEADHLGQQHRLRLAQHRRLRLDPADAPAQNAKAVDHGGMRVRAHKCVGIGDLDSLASLVRLHVRPNGLREIFEIDLMADAGAWRHDAEVLEGALTPFEELIALEVLLVFALDVLLQGPVRAEEIGHHGMVDHEIDRH